MARHGILLGGLAASLLMTATPVVADDLMVPSDASGPLKDFRGKPWFQPLAYCTAVYVVEANDFAADGRTDASDSARNNGAGFLASASRRMEKDRDITFGDAMEEVGAAVRQWQFAVIALKGNPGYFRQAHKGCAAIERAFARAKG